MSKKTRLNIVYLILSFSLPAVGYYFLWQLIGQDSINRIGYYLWVYSSVEDLLNFLRINVIKAIFQFLMPVFFGFLGLAWRLYFQNRSARKLRLRDDPAG